MTIETIPLTHKDPIRILIVDDDNAMLRLLAHEFRLRFANSADVFTCHESSEAISLCAKLEIEVLITDLNMDNFNGLHLLKHAKKNWPFMQVVIMTGSDSANAIESALALGADDYFVKPVASSLLVDCVSFLARRVARWKASVPQLDCHPNSRVESNKVDLAAT